MKNKVRETGFRFQFQQDLFSNAKLFICKYINFWFSTSVHKRLAPFQTFG